MLFVISFHWLWSEMTFRTHHKCKTLYLTNGIVRYKVNATSHLVYHMLQYWIQIIHANSLRAAGCCDERGLGCIAAVLLKPQSAEVSLSKTVNPCQLRERGSSADPVFWPPCTVGANSRGCIYRLLSRGIDHPKEEFSVHSSLSTRRSVCRVIFGTAPLENGRGSLVCSRTHPPQEK